MKSINRIGMLAAIALAFVGCSKEIEIQKPEENLEGTHTLTFKVEKAADTRTSVVEGDGVASYLWTEGDDAYFHIYENGKAATEIQMSLSSDNKIATFTATFNDTDTTAYSYTAVYGSEVSDNLNPLIPDTQKPVLNSFDPAADVLVSAEPITLSGNVAADANTEFKFKLQRVVSVNKMTLKGLEEGEVIKTVELISSDNYFSARYGFVNGNYNNAKKSLTLDYTSLSDAVVGTDGTFPVYFTSAPVADASFSVRVTTDKNVYLRDDFTSKLTLAVGTFRRFGIQLGNYGTPISTGTVFTLVESSADLFDGATYLIAASDVDAVMGLYTGGNNHPAVVVDKGTNESGKSIITIDNTITAEPVIISSVGDNWIITNAAEGNSYEGQYLICGTGNNNRLQESNDGSSVRNWTITISNGEATIINAFDGDRTHLYYNENKSGSPLFACYATQTNSNYHSIALYVDKTTCVELEDPELSFDEPVVEVDWEDIDEFNAPSLNNPHSVEVTYSSSNEDVATVSSTGEITFIGDGTTTITASSAKGNGYAAGTAQYTLTVTGAPVSYDFTTIAELNSLVSSESSSYSGKLTDAVVSFVPAANTAIIKDATGSITYYKSGHGLLQGQTFDGELTVTAVLYSSTSGNTVYPLYSEITAFSDGITFSGTGAPIEPQAITLTQLKNSYSEWQNAYVKLSGVTVVSQSGKNITVKDGENTYIVYDNTNSIAVSADDIITVKGTITKYQTTEELKVWSADDLTIDEHTAVSHVITFEQPAEGGSFTVTVDGSEIESGAEVMEGKTVSLSAIPSTGYTFNGWTVTGATVSGNTATATFLVGITDVNIVASFRSNTATIPDPETIVFADLGLENGVKYSDPFDGGDFTIKFQGGSNDGKYYDTGTGIRTYGGGSITIASTNYKIASIVFTWDGSNAPTSDVANPSGYSTTTKTWTGSANSVVLTRPSGSGHWRLQSVTVTFE